MKGRIHSRELKLEVCRQIASEEERSTHVCREYVEDAVLLRCNSAIKYENYCEAERLSMNEHRHAAWNDGPSRIPANAPHRVIGRIIL